MDAADFQRTADIAEQFKVIKKPATEDAYRTDLAEAAPSARSEGRGRRRDGEGHRLGEGRTGRGDRGRATWVPPRGGGNELEEGRSACPILIKGGRVITAADDYVGDVFVEDERISADRRVARRRRRPRDRRAGKYVLPGGVDPHTHLDMPFGGTVTIDDVESGPDGGRVRRHDLPRRLRHPAAGLDLRPRRSTSGSRRRTASR